MRLIYIANIRLPTEKAHGIQIMKMCEAFAEKGIDVELLVPARRNDLIDDPFEFYGVKRIFRIKKLPCLDILRFDFAKAGFLISTFTFLSAAKIYLAFRNYDALYARERLVGLLFTNYILEVHALPKRLGRFFRWLLHVCRFRRRAQRCPPNESYRTARRLSRPCFFGGGRSCGDAPRRADRCLWNSR